MLAAADVVAGVVAVVVSLIPAAAGVVDADVVVSEQLFPKKRMCCFPFHHDHYTCPVRVVDVCCVLLLCSLVLL